MDYSRKINSAAAFRGLEHEIASSRAVFFFFFFKQNFHQLNIVRLH